LRSSLNGNCLSDDTRILCSTNMINSSMKKKKSNPANYREIDFEDDIGLVEEILPEYCNDVIIHIAGFVERYIKEQIKCEECINCVSTDEIVYGLLTIIKNRGHLIYPQKSIYEICKIAEQKIRCINVKKSNFYEELIIKVMMSISNSNIFSNFKHSRNDLNFNHRNLLIRTIVEYFIKIRCFHIAKGINISKTTNFVRSKYSKLILFNNQ
jgi:hypothetical protein